MKKLLVIFLACLSLQVNSSDIDGRKDHIKKMEIKVSVVSENRKARSEAILEKYKIPINHGLPYIEGEDEALIRSKEEIAKRAISLLVIAVKAEGLEQDIVDSLINKYELKSVLSPDETKFVNDRSPSQHDKTQFIWRYEAAWVLLWSLGYIDELNHPNSICNVATAITILQQRSKDQFIADSQLRSISEILDEADLIYRYHWAVVDARINGKPTPSGIDSSVVLERHYSLNWLIGYMGQERDNISTDT